MDNREFSTFFQPSQTMPNLFEVLGLPSSPTVSPDSLKSAYHQALLRYHPDKNGKVKPGHSTSEVFSVDEITLAYKTLLDPSKRAKHLQEIRLSNFGGRDGTDGTKLSPGLEVVDLDDLVYDDALSAWTRDCRCGTIPGFFLTEDELEREAKHGEILVGCRGCSLWLKVLFQLVLDDG